MSAAILPTKEYKAALPPPPPPKTSAPPAQPAKPRSPAPPPVTTAKPVDLVTTDGPTAGGQRIGIYGPGGIGKSSLAAALAQVGKKPRFLDTDDGSRELDVHRITIENWDALRQALSPSDEWNNYDAVVIDSITTAEEMAVEWTLKNIRTEKNAVPTSIEGYGYGKGYVHVYETFMLLLGQLRWHRSQGREIVLICHDCTSMRPNPDGEDYPRFEPRLQSPNSGKNSIRHRIKEWLDHLFWIGYDINVEKGKAQGMGTRTIYPQEMPTFWAKSRRLEAPVVFEKGSAELWKRLFGV